MKIYKVLPDLDKQRQLKLWHKALRSQWSAADVAWDTPQRITGRRLKDQLGRLLTPVLMGEQSALYSVSGLIPVLGKMSEVESQFYLTTWAVDEARHTELLARFYRRIDRRPMTIRRFPSAYLLQAQIVSDEPAEWLSGVLISEVSAKKLMEEFRRIDVDPVLSKIADGILQDEARHLGFNHIYLEDRFCELYRNAEDRGRGFADRLRGRLANVLSYLPATLDALATEFDEIGIDRGALREAVERESRERLEKSIRLGWKRGAGETEASRLAEAELVGA